MPPILVDVSSLLGALGCVFDNAEMLLHDAMLLARRAHQFAQRRVITNFDLATVGFAASLRGEPFLTEPLLACWQLKGRHRFIFSGC